MSNFVQYGRNPDASQLILKPVLLKSVGITSEGIALIQVAGKALWLESIISILRFK